MCKTCKGKYYMTTAIAYTSGKPHIEILMRSYWQTGIKLVFSKDFYKAILIYSAILPEAISLHISILILINKKRYNRFNEKIL